MAKARSLLSQLTDRPLARPCDEPWEQMIGDDRVRRCGACARDVYDVSQMSALEAEIRLLNAGVAAPCVRYLRRLDGSVAHQPPPSSWSPPAPPRALAAAAALGATLSATAYAEDKKPADKAPAQCVAYNRAPTAEPVASGTAALAEAPPPPPDKPIMLAGEPAMVDHPLVFGTLVLRSKVAREITIVGVKLTAPLASYSLTPGDFVADVRDPGGKLRQVRFKITKDKKTVVDLDKR